MSEDHRDDSGQFRPEHDDREFLLAVADHEPAGTAEVAEVVGVTRQNADRRLRELETEGRVTSKRIGNSLAWRLADGETVARPVDPDDDFWAAETYAGEEMSVDGIDDVLYG